MGAATVRVVYEKDVSRIDVTPKALDDSLGGAMQCSQAKECARLIAARRFSFRFSAVESTLPGESWCKSGANAMGRVLPAVASSEEAVPTAPTFHGFDHIEWWVGNARHTAAFFVNGFGFDVVAYAGPETGSPTGSAPVKR